MKKILIALLACAAVLQLPAQESRRLNFNRDSLRIKESFSLPDSLAHLSPWSPDTNISLPGSVKPSVTMTSVVTVNQENLPSRVTVIDNNTLRLGRFFNVGNGQAWNNGPFPNAYLDARTLSFPGRR